MIINTKYSHQSQGVFLIFFNYSTGGLIIVASIVYPFLDAVKVINKHEVVRNYAIILQIVLYNLLNSFVEKLLLTLEIKKSPKQKQNHVSGEVEFKWKYGLTRKEMTVDFDSKQRVVHGVFRVP